MPVVNGTTYNDKTPEDLIRVLEKIRLNGIRCHFHYGDAKTGRPWGDVETGRLGRSMGPKMKIPITLYNRRSIAGAGLLDHCVIKITKTRGGECLYKLPKEYKLDESSNV